MENGGRSRIIDITPKRRASDRQDLVLGVIAGGLAITATVGWIAYELWQEEKTAAQCRTGEAAFHAVQAAFARENTFTVRTTLPPYGHPGMRVTPVKGRSCTFEIYTYVIVDDGRSQRSTYPFTGRAGLERSERTWLVDPISIYP